MKVSIILITYNQSQFITQCLESIIIQDLEADVELVVADDCSTDDTLLIIKQFLKNSSFSILVLPAENNLGFVKNYQRAFRACTGEYIAVMEGDDYWTDPRRLQKHFNFLENHRECVMSMNRFIAYNQFNFSYTVTDWPYKDDFIYVSGQEMALENRLGNMSACVFRKSEIDKLKTDLFELLIADWMIGIVLSQYGFIAILKEAMSVYRIHGQGQFSKMNAAEQLVIMNKHIDEYNKYLDFKYDKEFNQHKDRLNGTTKNIPGKSRMLEYVPPFFIYLAKLFIPPALLKMLKAKTHN